MNKYVIGFIAGFIATLLFHQPALATLAAVGFVKAGVYSMQATQPLGVPAVLSLSFWGGVWGILFVAIEKRFPQGAAYWLCAFAFGALGPTLVAWFVVAPIKGLPLAGGWQLPRVITGLLINGAWGVGTALFFVLWQRTWGARASASPNRGSEAHD
jgi:hypothetical protein